MDLLIKIKKANLKGRGGASFPVYKKWSLVLKSKSKDKFLVVNGAEGEPGVKKDEYIIKNYTADLIAGINICAKYIKAKKVIIFLNHNYKKHQKILDEYIGNKNINIIYKPKDGGYLAGEESSMLNIIESKLVEPKIKPPFPGISGLKDSPTLIHNVETIYNIALIDKGDYQDKRFYTIGGDVKNPGVYYLPSDYSIARVLEETNNLPNFKFFLQHGGQASGEVLNSSQLSGKVGGSGSITIYNLKNHDEFNFIKNLVNFYFHNSCGKCTPCREGTYRLKEMLSGEKMNWSHFMDLVNNMESSSFCALGSSLAIPVKSYIKNVNPKFQPKL